MNRRDFLKTGATVAWSLALSGIGAAAEPAVKFPVAARDRLAVASWPFRKQYSPHGGTIGLEHFPGMVVSRFGVKGVEPLSDHFPSTDAAYLALLRNELEKTGTHVVNIPTNPHGSLYDPDEQKRMAAVKTAKRWVDIAAKIGSPSIRVSVTGPRGTARDEGRTIESLKAIADYGTYKNVVVSLENDDPHSEDAFFLTRVMDAVHSPYLRALPDFAIR